MGTLVQQPIGQRASARTVFPIGTLALLGQFAPQGKREEERTQIVAKPTSMQGVAKIDGIFARVISLDWDKPRPWSPYHEIIERLKWASRLGLLRYSGQDLAYFSQAVLPKYASHIYIPYAGEMLSALINLCRDKDITIFTDCCDFEIERLGEKNRKNLTVYGNVGKHFCVWQVGGNVVLHGNAGDFMAVTKTGGSLTVHGNVGVSACYDAKGGDTTINGSVHYSILADDFHGGTLTVNGQVAKWASCCRRMDGGTVYLNGIKEPLVVGQEMKGGAIFLDGDLPKTILDLFGGELHVNGNVPISAIRASDATLSLTSKANIFQRGRQLVQNGSIIAQPENK